MTKPRQSAADRRRIKRQLDEMSLEKRGSEEYRRILQAIHTYGQPTPEEDIIYPDSLPKPKTDFLLHKRMKRYYRA